MNGFRCEPCTLTIEKIHGAYCYAKPGVVIPTKLGDHDVVKRAYETLSALRTGDDATIAASRCRSQRSPMHDRLYGLVRPVRLKLVSVSGDLRRYPT
jgi:hypothetical protein